LSQIRESPPPETETKKGFPPPFAGEGQGGGNARHFRFPVRAGPFLPAAGLEHQRFSRHRVLSEACREPLW
jgi:hypothetical protein